MIDTGDEQQVKGKKAAHVLAREKEIAELHGMLQTYGGRSFIWRILEKCEIHSFGFCGDNNLLNHKEGQRSIGGWVLEEVFTSDPNAYNIMKNEAVSRDAVSKRETKGR